MSAINGAPLREIYSIAIGDTRSEGEDPLWTNIAKEKKQKYLDDPPGVYLSRCW